MPLTCNVNVPKGMILSVDLCYQKLRVLVLFNAFHRSPDFNIDPHRLPLA